MAKQSASRPRQRRTGSVEGVGAGSVGTRNLRRVTFVRVEGPPGTPPGTPVSVDGEPNFLVTGAPQKVEAREHLFELTVDGAAFRRRRHCPAGHSAGNPFLVRVDLPAAEGAQRPLGTPEIGPSRKTPVMALRPVKKQVPLIVAEGLAPDAQTAVYVHGIGNKPEASILKCQWDMALFGTAVGDRSRMAYWVNREYYPVPAEATCASPDSVDIDDDEATSNAIMALAGRMPPGEQEERENRALDREIEALAQKQADREDWLRRLAERMRAAGAVDAAALAAEQQELGRELQALRAAHQRGALSYEEARDLPEREQDLYGYTARVLPLPSFLRRLVTGKLTRAFLRDVNDFFFEPDRRAAMTASLADRLRAGGGPFVVIAHSQGSMIAYEVLRHLTRQECHVKLLVTIGSPLGMQEVQDMFLQWEPDGLRVPACVDRWVNVADRLDPVAIDSDISNDVAPRGSVAVENHRGWGLNMDSPRHPHSGTGYLQTRFAQKAVRETVGNAFGQAVGRAIIARDLADQLEDSLRDRPHKTLIELAGDSTRDGPAASLRDTREQLVQFIREIARDRADGLPAEVNIDEMKRYVAADLTRLEIEKLRTRFADLNIQRVWRNAEKRSLIHRSTHTVQAWTANIGYQATGRDIGWAVLDTGIAAGHPHFREFGNVERQWDCTLPGPARELDPREESRAFERLDRNGHGTHVAGIIAGTLKATLKGVEQTFSGLAPHARLYGFKVLSDQGRGHDSYIIKALDMIADLNESMGKPVIHGVNLSLGGNFDPSVYGCGHTPLCQELRRLWRQGVLVVLAAGNEGYALLQGADGEIPTNLDISIGDPANLDEAIAVGSVHKRNPHTYGISYFSSRGPTADGRRKPDLVAPGEQILSAAHSFPDDRPAGAPEGRAPYRAEDLYVEMSGTSMAAPHVSGILAAFLSVHREFIGYPDRVRQILLDNCTDLGRDPYIQGAGMPNLVKMLSNT